MNVECMLISVPRIQFFGKKLRSIHSTLLKRKMMDALYLHMYAPKAEASKNMYPAQSYNPYIDPGFSVFTHTLMITTPITSWLKVARSDPSFKRFTRHLPAFLKEAIHPHLQNSMLLYLAATSACERLQRTLYPANTSRYLQCTHSACPEHQT